MRYHFKIHKEKGGFWAEGVELKGCRSEGETMEQLEKNLHEAVDLFLSEPVDSPLEFPLPTKKLSTSKTVISIPVSPRVAFAMMLKRIRLKHKLTQAAAARRIGITGRLWLYQRLEAPKNANPTLETLERVKRAFPEFSVEQVLG